MAIRVSEEDLTQFNALRKMQKAFPGEADQFKQRKKDWWRRIRQIHEIPANIKIRLGTETGVIINSDTGQPYDPASAPAKPMWLRVSATALATQLREDVEDGALDASVQGCSEVQEGTFNASSVDPAGTVKRDGYNNFYVKLD